MYCFNQQHNCTKINDKDYILNALLLLLYLIKIYAIIIVILNYILVIEIVTVILITIF